MPFLFSYGTLQQEDVQLSTFGRTLTGRSDQLENFEQSMVLIEDQEVKAKSGKTHHPIVKFTGRSSDRVDGTVFEITEVELGAADAYEVDAYKRIAVILASGLGAWVYVDARYTRRTIGKSGHSTEASRNLPPYVDAAALRLDIARQSANAGALSDAPRVRTTRGGDPWTFD
jgi:hypothetical protein